MEKSLFEGDGISVYEEVKHAETQKTIQEILDMRSEKAEKAKAKGARLTPSQWREIDMLWESGEVTVADLTRRYGRSRECFVSHYKKHGIVKGAKKEELRKAAELAAREQSRNEAAILSERIRKTKEEHYKMAEAIGRLTFNEILKARQDGKPFRSIQQDVKALLLAAETLKKVREERWVTLGLDKDVVDEDTLPELVMTTMTEEQCQQLRQAQQEDEMDLGLNDDDLVV